MGHFWVRVLSVLNFEVNVGPMCSFSQKRIMEMECELLVSNLKDPKIIALMKENIRCISDGSSTHCAGALKLVLKKAFELKKQQLQPPGVLLRCTYTSCAWYSNHVSYSSVRPNNYCQNCLNYRYGCRYLQCAGCGYARTINCVSCQGCGKRFR